MTDDKKLEIERMTRELQLEHYKAYSASHLENHNEYRRTILTLLTGAIGGSLALLSLNIFESGMIALWLMVVSWIIAGIGSSCVLLSYFYVDQIFTIYMDIFQDALLQVESSTYLERKMKGQRLSKISHYLNWAAGISLIISVGLLSAFFLTNAKNHHDKRAKDSANQPQRDESHTAQ